MQWSRRTLTVARRVAGALRRRLRNSGRWVRGLPPVSNVLHPQAAEDPLRVWIRHGDVTRLVVSLSDVGRDRNKQPPPGMATTLCRIDTDTCLFLADASRSWLNAPGLAEAMVAEIERQAARIGAREVVALGNSMGATTALHLARLTRIDRVLAMGPRFSVDPKVVGAEKGAFGRRGLSRPLRFADLSGLPPASCDVTILLGATPRELAHAGHFPVGDNQRVLILPDVDHHVAVRLHERRLLGRVVSAGLAGDTRRLDALLAPLGAIGCDRFLNRLTEADEAGAAPPAGAAQLAKGGR